MSPPECQHLVFPLRMLAWPAVKSMNCCEFIYLRYIVFPSIPSLVFTSYSCSGLSLFLNLIGRDAKSRVHFVEIELDETYPKSPPRVSAVGLFQSLW